MSSPIARRTLRIRNDPACLEYGWWIRPGRRSNIRRGIVIAAAAAVVVIVVAGIAAIKSVWTHTRRERAQERVVGIP